MIEVLDWASRNKPNSYIQFDFQARSVCVTKYTIRFPSGKVYPRHWSLQASIDEKTWTDIHIVNTEENLIGRLRSFEIDEEHQRFYQFFRLIQLGKTNKNKDGNETDCLCISQIEFFGSVRGLE